MTYTYVILDVSPACYGEIAAKLRAAQYDHAFDKDVIDMHGIALREEAKPVDCPRVRTTPSPVTNGLNHWSFVECDTCRAKLGSPMLCEGCQHNREVIARLTTPAETLTARISEFVRRHPGRTAWGIAKELGASSASASSILRRLAARGGELRRAKGARGSWVYYDKRFGHD